MARTGTVSGRHFTIVLYPDDPQFDAYLDNLGSSFNFLCVLHDKDLDDDGNYKKQHLHVYFESPNSNPVRLSTVCNKIGVDHGVEIVKRKRRFLRYLLHMDEPNKTQYSVDAVQGYNSDVLFSDFLSAVSDVSEDSYMTDIIDLLNSIDRFIELDEFIVLLCSHKLYAPFRRSGWIGRELLGNHNLKFIKESV